MTPEQLAQATGAKLADARAAAPHLADAMQSFGIVGPERAPRFLGQIAHESAGFSRLEENLRYTTPERIRAVWPSRFPSVGAAQPYARNPEALANKVYGDRMGNKRPGDGWRYRGRGYKMLTGAENYAEATRALSHILGVDFTRDPDAAAEPRNAAWIAAWFWSSRGLNEQADAGRDETITRRINGGLIGHPDRLALIHRAREALA